MAATLLIPAALVTLFSRPLITEGSWLDLGIDAMAWAAFVAGASLRFWATLYIGGRKEIDVVTEGPYSICRNPLYVGSLLLSLSTGLFLKSVIFAGALLLVTVIYIVTTVPVEESYLRARHGQRYERYARLVPRYWPSIQGFRTPEKITVDIHRLRLECARASRWLWLPFLGEALAHLRAHPSWPQLSLWL